MFIGLVGQARSGKDTAADMMIEAGVVSRKYSLADPLKRMVNTLLGWDADHIALHGKDTRCTVDLSRKDYFYKLKGAVEEAESSGFIRVLNKRYASPRQWFHSTYLELDKLSIRNPGFSPRVAYQYFGTDICRKKFGDVWFAIAPTKDVVIPDIRFQDEANWVRSNGGVLIRIDRDEAARIQTAGGKPVNAHVSEQELKGIETDTTVYNIGELAQLRQGIKAACSRLS